MAFELSNPSTADTTGWVVVPFVAGPGGDEAAIASALLTAAGDDRVDEVFAQSGAFLVPADIAVTAGLAPAEPAVADVVEENAAAAVEAAAATKRSKAAPADPAPADAPTA